MAGKEGNGVFTPADALAAFGLDMIDTTDCTGWLVSMLHRDFPACPHCSSPIAPVIEEKRTPLDENRLSRYRLLEQVRCPACSRKITAATGTMIDGSKLDPREIYLLAVLLGLDIPTRQIADVLHLDPTTVRSWEKKFKALAEVAVA